MDNQIIEKFSAEKKRAIAVAYLLRNESDRPQGTEKLFNKLTTSEATAVDLSNSIKQSEESLQRLHEAFMKTLGSLHTITEIIAESLPEEKIYGWCKKYQPPQNFSHTPDENVIMKNNKMAPPIDVAGVTAKQRQ